MLNKKLYLSTIPVIMFCIILSFISGRREARANQAPVAQNQSVITNEDTAKAITLIATGADGNPLTYTIVSAPLHGTLTGTPPKVTFKPATNYNGENSFTFKANDGTLDSNIATVSITIIAVNDPPVAKAQSVTTNRNTAKGITLAATDADNDPLTYQIVAGPSHGILGGAPPAITYTPAADYAGSDSFTFKANDGTVDSNVATISITVVNHAPVANKQSVSVNKNTAKTITLVASDTDKDLLAYQVVTQPSHGVLSGTSPNITYSPATNYAGSDSFTFKANDGMVDSNVATVSITVINHAPVANKQSVSTYKNTAKTITLGATDSDKDPLTYMIVAQPLHGTLNGAPPTMTYTPAANYAGSDSFTFKVNDGMVDSNIATISITVVNRAPMAQNQSVSTNKNTAKTITLGATDSDKDSLTYMIVAQPLHGTLNGAPPTMTYTPAANYAGSDGFTFKVNDGMVDSNIATISITVVNRVPVAQNQSVSINKNTAKAISLVATDADKDPLIYQVITQPSHGTLSGTPPSLTYTPAASYSGSDNFTFKVNDGMVDSNIATVSITVVNRVPVAQNQSVSTNKNTARAISLVATDADKDPLTYQVVTQPSHGALSGTPSSLTYTPAASYSGSDNFTFKVNDGMVDSNIATISITVVNRAPLTQNQSVTSNEDTVKAIALLATDPDGDGLIYTIVTLPGHGTLTGTPPNMTYTPTAHYYGSDSFTFKANDGYLDSNVATVSVTITRVNHPPVAQDQSITMSKNSARAITLVATDADNDPLKYLIVDQPAHGSLSGTLPSVIYTPAEDYSGSDRFTFKSYDGQAYSNVATVSITVSTIITTVAGCGLYGYAGDGGPADKAQLDEPWGVATDASGNLYISDNRNFRVRKVDGSGSIATYAGRGSGDCWSEGPVSSTDIGYPQGIGLDSSGSLYIADPSCHRIRKVDRMGNLTTVAGGYPPCCYSDAWSGAYGGDGGLANTPEVALNYPEAVAVDALGNLFIADTKNNRIRKVDTNGVITTVAGNGIRGYSGDRGPAIQASLNSPSGVALDNPGDLYIADTDNNRIRKVDANGIITTIAGSGIGGYGGDGGPATTAKLGCPYDVAMTDWETFILPTVAIAVFVKLTSAASLLQ